MTDKKVFWKNVVGVKDETVLKALEKHSTEWNLKKGDLVIREGTIVTQIPFLISGVLKAFYTETSEKNRVYCFGYVPGEPVTAITALGTGAKSACTVEALSNCSLMYISMETLLGLVRNNLEAARVYNRLLSMSIRKIMEHEKILASCDARERYRWFIETYPGLAEQINKKDIASYLNMSPETLSRILKN